MSNQPRKPIVTTSDYDRLKDRLLSRSATGRDPQWNLIALSEELEHAMLVLPQQVPGDVVTMNSTLRLSSPGREPSIYTIVYPEDVDLDADRISILSPVALALFGHRAGDEIDRMTPVGPRRYVVEEILFQPEAARRWDL